MGWSTGVISLTRATGVLPVFCEITDSEEESSVEVFARVIGEPAHVSSCFDASRPGRASQSD
jgi:hypothetical protein